VTKAFAISWKDLRATMRNVPALVMMLIAPLALAGLLGLAFGGGSSFKIAATNVAVANADTAVAAGQAGQTGQGGPAMGGSVVSVLTRPELKDVLNVTEVGDAGAARARVDDGKAAVAVIVPPDFSAAMYGTGSRQSAVELYENPTQELGSSIVAAVVSRTLLDLNGARAAAAAAAVTAGDAGGDPAAAADPAASAAARFIRDGGVSSALVVTEREPRSEATRQSKQVGVSAQILAGMMIFFMFFGASNVARTILTEDRAGTLPRLLTTPTPTRTILGGKFGSVFLTVTVQAVVLLIAGRILFGIDWGRLDAVVLLTLSAATVASGLALLVISVVRTPAQAGSIGAGVYLVLALLGGNFTGTATVGSTFATLQKSTPNGWLIAGWDTVMRGGTPADIVPEVLVPLVFGVVFFVIAVARFRRRYA
jgi:ABC-2 type transport system permease protein